MIQKIDIALEGSCRKNKSRFMEKTFSKCCESYKTDCCDHLDGDKAFGCGLLHDIWI